MAYGWIITRDHLAEQWGESTDEVGTMGPRDISDDIANALRAGKGRTFRMYDDDNELYYSGRILWSEDHEDRWNDQGFEPLEDFGTPGAGCTGIKYPGSGPEFGGGRYL